MHSPSGSHWRTRTLTSVAALICGYAVFGAAPVQAAESAAEAEEASVSEIVVTARRRDERLQDVPAAITAVGRSTLDRYSVATVQDVAKMVPQLLVTKTANGTTSSIFLRGVGSSSFSVGFDQSVSVNIDGVQVSRGNAIAIGYLDLAQLEVLKGPQALYFGKNSPAGIISLKTEDPSRGSPRFAKAGYNFDTRQAYAEAGGNLAVSDVLGARLAVRYSRQDGYFINDARDVLDRGVVIRGAEHPRGERSNEVSGRLTLLFTPNDQFTAKLKAFASQQRGDPIPRQTLRCVAGTPAPVLGLVNPNEDCKLNRHYTQYQIPTTYLTNFPGARDGNPYNFTDVQLLSADLNYDFGQYTLTSITSYYHNDARYFIDTGGGTSFTAEHQDYSATSQEFRLASEWDGPVNMVAGAYFQDSDLPYNQTARFANLPQDAASGKWHTIEKDVSTKGTTWSAFAEVIWDITPEIELDAGVRWTRERKKFDYVNPYVHPLVRAALAFNQPIADRFTDENLSPQATLTWRPSSDLTYYVAYKTGFKSGGYNSSANPAPGAQAAAFKYESETAKGFEGGIKALLDDQRLSVNLAVYDYDYKDLQVLVFDSTTATFFARNAGKLTTRGFEVDGTWDVSPSVDGLSLRGSLAYNRARYADYIGPCFSGQTPAAGCNLNFQANKFNAQLYSGRTPPKAPKWGGSAGFTYEQEVGADLSLSFSGDARYTSSFNPHDALRADAKQDGFVLVDATVRLASDKNWSLAAIGRNLTNERVVYAAGDFPLTGSGTGLTTGVAADINAVVGDGRQFVIEASYRF